MIRCASDLNLGDTFKLHVYGVVIGLTPTNGPYVTVEAELDSNDILPGNVAFTCRTNRKFSICNDDGGST